jgi:hypothetical protein
VHAAAVTARTPVRYASVDNGFRGGSGYADRPARICSSDLEFQDTSCRHLFIEFALGPGVLGAADGDGVANADISRTSAEQEATEPAD